MSRWYIHWHAVFLLEGRSLQSRRGADLGDTESRQTATMPPLWWQENIRIPGTEHNFCAVEKELPV